MQKFCINCKYYARPYGEICQHPSLGVDPVHGLVKSETPTFMRRLGAPCGPDGKLFENYNALTQMVCLIRGLSIIILVSAIIIFVTWVIK